MNHKLARICWNDRRWQQPSGRDGKSKKPGAFEDDYGFGHEEWLFDTSKVIDGYHYGFVQAVAASREKYRGESFQLSLYSIYDRTRQRWWLGRIRKISVIDEGESARIYEIYKSSGWLDQMRLQLKGVGADLDAFERYVTPTNFAVLKFAVADLDLLDEPLEFAFGDPAVTSDYYNLKNYVGEPSFPARPCTFAFKPGHVPPTDKKRIQYEQRDCEASNHHNHVQTSLYENLCTKHGADNVGTENNTGVGSRVDVVVRIEEKFALYEIKTGPSLQACVREAVGQLLEYRHIIGRSHVAKMVVVSPHPSDEHVDRYLEALRLEHALPLYYEQCVG